LFFQLKGKVLLVVRILTTHKPKQRLGRNAKDAKNPVVWRERFGARGIHIPYIFPIQWGAKELLRVSQASNSIDHLFLGRKFDP